MDKKLVTYLRMLSYKMMQIVVQSRLGCKIHTTAQPESSKYCFHITIDDIPEVALETRRALSNRQIDEQNSLSIEISLKTVAGESMTVEIWTLEMHSEKTVQEQLQQPQQQQPQADDSGSDSGDDRDSFSVYNRMSGMLKALLSITRTTPAYKLSRGQAPDSYVMCYRICYGRPNLELLGTDCESMQIGCVKTSIGEIVMRGTYRTRMTIDQPRDTGAVGAADSRLKTTPVCTGTCSAARNRTDKSEDRYREMCKKEIWDTLTFDEKTEVFENRTWTRGAFATNTHVDDYDWETYLPGFKGLPFPIRNETFTMAETKPDGTKTEWTEKFRILPKLPFDMRELGAIWLNDSPDPIAPQNRTTTATTANTEKKSPRKPKSNKTPKPKPKPKKPSFGDLYCPFAEPRNPRKLNDYFLEVQRTKPLKRNKDEPTVDYLIPLGSQRQRNEQRHKEIRRVMQRRRLDYKTAEATLPPPAQPLREFVKEHEKVHEQLTEFIRKFNEMKMNEESGDASTAASGTDANQSGCGGGGGGSTIDLLLD